MLQQGFTLIELMIVVAIIGIFATMTAPNYAPFVQRAQITDGLSMIGGVKKSIEEYYEAYAEFPADNAEAGVPEPYYMMGNRVSSIYIDYGAINIELGNKVSSHLAGKILTVRPATVNDSPESPISWLCGYSEPVNGMYAVGENNTNVDFKALPIDCRS